MIEAAILIGFTAVAIAMLLNLYRLLRGPDLLDRILALDTLTTNGIALILLYGIAHGTGSCFEAALIMAMFGFVTTVAFAKFLLRGDVIE